MPEWLVEEGIGEHRAILLDSGHILAARLAWPGELAAGQVENALLLSRAAGSRRGTLRFASGEEALIDGLPREASEGVALTAVVTRAAIGEKGRAKRARARPADGPPRPAPTLAESLRNGGTAVRIVPRFPESAEEDWSALLLEAWDSVTEFDGGSLIFSPTPAMTLIDVDGTLPRPALAMRAVPAIASAVRRFDLGGSIGIDFPTLDRKADRRAVDEALTSALTDWPHERTAMNGFGFVQLVARLERPSLLHRVAMDPAGAAARALLRRAERVTDPGALRLTGNRHVLAAVRLDWRDELARRTGRVLHWHEDRMLALEAAYAQAVPL